MPNEPFDSLTHQLVKLSDLLETCDPGDANHKYYSKEYRKVSKALFPDMYPRKQRKPSQSIIRTLKKCTCGADGWKFKPHGRDKGVQIKCKNENCNRAGEIKPTNKQAAASWNDSFILRQAQDDKLPL